MDSIYHEQQVGQLCAQHCLNNLLQGPFFDAVQLAEIARKLDEAERARLTEGHVSASQVLKVMENPSTNMDDSGFFSVQVISDALKIFNLEITTSFAPRMKIAMETPVEQMAFICNHDFHWITIRKLGKQWFNLDSLKKGPELISDMYLNLFLAQLQMEGYSIFVVTGNLPSCEANELLTLIPVESTAASKTTSPHNYQQDKDDYESEEIALATAISASLASTTPLSSEEMRQKRLQSLERRQNQ